MAAYTREILRLLTEDGWFVVKGAGKGSHIKLQHPTKPGSMTVPHDCHKRHTANDILKQAGLPKAF